MTDLERQRADARPGPGVTYEAARAELEEIVRRLEAGGSTLEDSLALWERGEELATVCQRLLDGARARLAGDALAHQPSGAPAPTAPRDPAGS